MKDALTQKAERLLDVNVTMDTWASEVIEVITALLKERATIRALVTSADGLTAKTPPPTKGAVG